MDKAENGRRLTLRSCAVRGPSGKDLSPELAALSARVSMLEAICVLNGMDATIQGDQRNAVTAAYMDQVAYDPADSNDTHVLTYYAIPTDYRKDQPAGLPLTLRRAGTFTINDAGGTLRRTVTAGTEFIHNLTPGRAAPYTVTDNSGQVLQAGSMIATGALRMIKLDSVNNVRDMGGWPCDGGKLRYGLIFRGGHLDNITLTDKTEMLNVLRIAAETDLRNPAEISGAASPLGSSVDYSRISSLQYLDAVDLGDNGKISVTAAVLRRVLDFALAGKPHYLHCASGCDRTGTIAFLIAGLCGVDRSCLDKEYELSSFSSEGQSATRSRVLTNWQALVNYISTMDGQTLLDQFVSWWILAGFTISEINALRTALIEGTPTPVTSSINYDATDLTMSQEIAVGTIDETMILTASPTPTWATSTITWVSSDISVATVSGNGRSAAVTLIGAGSATVTASCNGHTATCNISVYNSELIYTTTSSGSDNQAGIKIDSNDHVTVTTNQPNYAATDFVATAGYTRFQLSNSYDEMPHDGSSINNVYIIWYDASKAYIAKTEIVGSNRFAPMNTLSGIIPEEAAYYRVRAYSGENATEKDGWFNGMTVKLGSFAT